jgi:hypothetical protein
VCTFALNPDQSFLKGKKRGILIAFATCGLMTGNVGCHLLYAAKVINPTFLPLSKILNIEYYLKYYPT